MDTTEANVCGPFPAAVGDLGSQIDSDPCSFKRLGDMLARERFVTGQKATTANEHSHSCTQCGHPGRGLNCDDCV